MKTYTKYTIKGTVQGVGFRPFIYKLAIKKQLKGYILNNSEGVEILTDLDFLNEKDRKNINWPPLSIIDSIQSEQIELENEFNDFSIKDSKDNSESKHSSTQQSKNSSHTTTTNIPPDLFICKNCSKELNDPDSRRYKYYFATCTDCGPRFSMTRKTPYDRPNTSMDEFDMCSKCKNEYRNPLDRRYHAQTIACPDCGPKLSLLYNNLKLTKDSEDSYKIIKAAADIINQKKILSIKGIGGFHIVGLPSTILDIRFMLKRLDKPFALLAKDLDMIKEYCNVSKEEEHELTSVRRPIVVLKKKDSEIFKEISELDSLGFMLPYTALHQLLFDFIDEPLIMTSANMPGSPITTKEEIGEYFLTNERKIINKVDDSVVKIIDKTPYIIRRSRGYAPTPISLPFKTKNTLALGAEMNNTITVTTGNKAYVSQHIGNTSNYETFEHLKTTITELLNHTKVRPELIACDMHPDFNTTRHAEILSKKLNIPLVKVQHHKAHACAVAAEHNLDNFSAIICDGTGYGENETIWGGEVFNVDFTNKTSPFKRVGHLEEQYLIGGESSIKHPIKIAVGILTKFLKDEEIKKLDLLSEQELNLFLKQVHQKYNLTKTTSTGRILDAIAALLKLCRRSTYDGRHALLLESTAKNSNYKIPPLIKKLNNKQILSTTELFQHILNNIKNNSIKKKSIAFAAHQYIANGLYKIADSLNKPIVFSGGVAYNTHITKHLTKKGVLTHIEIPPGDGCISLGQAIYANKS